MKLKKNLLSVVVLVALFALITGAVIKERIMIAILSPFFI